MPARFVEVANLADDLRKSDPLSYIPHVSLNSTWSPRSLTYVFDKWTTNTTNGTAVHALSHLSAPRGLALYLMLGAVAVMLLHVVGVRVSARRAQRRYGHAHAS